MNTLGKILVVLNFVVALVVVGFLTHNYAARTNNYQTNEQLKQELDIARKNNQAMMDTTTGLQLQLTAVKSELETKKQDIALAQAQWAVREADLQRAFKDSEDRGKLAEINFAKALQAMERMEKEVAVLKTSIEDREDRLVKLHAKHKDIQDLAMSLDRDLKFSQDRNQILVGRVQELERSLSEIISGVKADSTAALPKDPTAANPPQKFMKGVVERVDGTDKSLVRISLGTDHGLKVGNTLDVYRTSPNPEYVGLIRIEDAHHHTAVARFVRSPGTTPRVAREGDIVSSSLNPRQ
jgi:hypothetical protein